VIRLGRIDHVRLRVDDLDEASERWCAQFGLVERARVQGVARLACDDEPFCLELSTLDEGPPGIEHAGYELHRDCSLEDARSHLETAGVAVEDRDGGLLLRDVERNGVHLLPARERTERERYVQHARPAAGVPGAPRKLGHVNFLTGRIEDQARFYMETLGMKLSDRLGDTGMWFRINSDHHVMALVDAGYAHPHHLAFEYVDFGHKIATLDHLARHGRWLGWGPARHGIAGNIASYVRIVEEECFVELYCDMERLGEDHEPRTYEDDRYSSNTWGPLPPRSYFRFDAAAIESERDSLETLGVPLAPAGSR
jgi:catechol 2,3-dioxygenase-like lactoylglutathione lyase family enzyme